MVYTWFIAQRFKSHHCHVRTTVYSILLYHTLFSLQYRLPYYFKFFLDSTIYIGRFKLRSLTFNFLTTICTLRYKLLMRLKIIKKVKVYQCDNEW